MTVPERPYHKMDVPVPVYNWLLTVKTELHIARGYRPTWPEVFNWLKEQHEAADHAKGERP